MKKGTTKNRDAAMMWHRNRIFSPSENPQGYWSTYVDDPSKARGRKKISRKDEDAFWAELAKHYQEAEPVRNLTAGQQVSVQDLYPEWIEHKRAETTAENYIDRINTTWKRYYRDTEIVAKPMQSISRRELDKWLHKIAKGKDGKGSMKKAYYNATIIMRQIFDYALSVGLIEHNTFADISIDTRRLLQVQRKKPDREEVFAEEEVKQIRDICLQEFSEPDYHRRYHLAPLAVLFQLQTGLRVGELVAVRYSDVEGDYLHVQRMYRKETKEIVQHTKTDAGDRMVVLTDEAGALIRMCRHYQQTHGCPSSGYIFSETLKPLPPSAVQRMYTLLCSQIGGAHRSSHKARKTVISSLIDGGVNINTVRLMAGHTDERTTYGSYVYDRSLEDAKKEKIKNALGSTYICYHESDLSE